MADPGIALPERHAPEGVELRGAGLLIPERGDSPGVATQALVRAGFAVWIAPEAVHDLDDRAGSVWLDGQLAEQVKVLREAGLSTDQSFALGLGSGGTRAFLLGCHSRTLAAVITVEAPLVYEELNAHRPSQPLELALNLGAALLWQGSTELTTAEGGLVEETLERFHRTYEMRRWTASRAVLLENLATPLEGSGDKEVNRSPGASVLSESVEFLSETLCT